LIENVLRNAKITEYQSTHSTSRYQYAGPKRAMSRNEKRGAASDDCLRGPFL
jgi:hypothetical protein